MAVLQICPEFPPAHGGLGDFAFRLGQEFEARSIASFVAARGATDAPTVHALRDGSLEEDLRACLKKYDGITILLDYSGYGFDARACPFWLPRVLSSRRAKLIVYFHETWAAGPVWHSTFWNLPMQRWIALRLATVADSIFCSSGRGLKQVTGGRHESPDARILPIPSTIGEPDDVVPIRDRPNEAAVFGLPAVRRRLFQVHGVRMEEFCRNHEITVLNDIGAALAAPPRLGEVEVRSYGHVPPARVSEILSASRFLFIDYDLDLLTKSSTVAAGMAHGIAIVNFAASRGREGAYWHTPEWNGFFEKEEMEALATAARNAYRDRSWHRVAQVLTEAL